MCTLIKILYFFNKVNPQFYVDMFTITKFFTEKFIFCAMICASKLTENYCEEENNLKNYVDSLFAFFEKVFAI